jgi:hypothetical protein
VWLGPGATADLVPPAIAGVLDPRRVDFARAYAKRYAAFSPMEQRRRIVARIEELVRNRGAILSPTQSQGTP